MQRALTLIGALVALLVLPATSLAAPKKVRLRFSSTAVSVNESNTTVNVSVVRAGNARVAATVNYDVVAGGTTAVAGVDYSFTPGTLSFAAGETRKTFPVTILDNSTYAPPNKKIVFHLSGATPGGSTIQGGDATLTILDNDGPGTIDFGQSSYSVVESAGIATVTVTRNTTANIIETVDYTTTALAAGTGHATAGTDYTTTAGTITFGAGESSKSFQVPVLDDSDFEGDETLDLTLANPQNLTNPLQQPTLGPNNGVPTTLTIVDDDVPTFSFSQPTYSADENDGTATITVTRGGATNVAASVDYSDAGTGSAVPTTDYTLTPGTLNFAAGETSKTFPVAIVDNGTGPEPNKTVGLQLKQGSTQVSTATLSIVDDDSPTPSVQFSDVAYSVNEATSSVDLTVTLTKPIDGDVTVHYATADGTATHSATLPAPTDGTADYTNTSGTLTFKGNLTNPGGVGETSKTVTIPLNPDTVAEDDETFTATLSANTNSTLGAPHQATVTVVDDDSTGTLDFSSQRYDVNETGGHARITVRRAAGTAGAASVDYATTDGTAHAPGDYTTTTGTLNFADGETQKTFDIPVAWDGRAEGDETVSIALSNFVSDDDPAATKVAVLHIADDGASAPVQFGAGAYDVSETDGKATITVSRSGGNLGGPVTVDYATSDGTAHAGADYTDTHGTLTFGPGDTTKTFQVPVIDDSVREGGRTATVTLSHPGGGTALGSPATAALNIGDDEPATSPSLDKTAPKLKLTAKKLQTALKIKRLVLKVRSNEAVKLTITASLRKGKKFVRVAKGPKTVGPGKTVTIKLKLSKKALSKLSTSLVKGRAKIKLTVTGTDAAGNKTTVRRTITVK